MSGYNCQIITNWTRRRLSGILRLCPRRFRPVTVTNAYYTDKPVLPDKVTVKAGKLTVPIDAYELTAANHTAVSTGAVLTVTAKAGSNYKGAKTKKFRIVKQELKNLCCQSYPDQPFLNQPVTFSNYPLQDWNGQDIGTDQYDITFKNNKNPERLLQYIRQK